MNYKQSIISLFWVFFIVFCNVYAFFYILNTGNLYDIYHNEILKGDLQLFFQLIAILAFYLSTIFIFNLFSNIKSDFGFDSSFSQRKQKILYRFILLFLLFYTALTIFYGLGKAGGESLTTENKFISFLALFRIDYFAVLYVAFFGLNKRTKIILIFFMISSFSRGWLGDIIVLFILLAALSGRSICVFFKPKYIFPLMAVIFMMPFLMEVRSYYRLGGIDAILNGQFPPIALSSFGFIHDIFLRFQQLYSLSFFFNNLNYFEALYSQGYIRPLYLEGVLQNKIYSIIAGESGDSLGYVFADTNRILIEGRRTAFTPGLIPYFWLSPISILYYLFVVCFTGFAASFFRAYPVVKILIFYYMIVLLSFGWLNAYVSFLFTLSLFVLFLGVRRKKVSNLN